MSRSRLRDQLWLQLALNAELAAAGRLQKAGRLIYRSDLHHNLIPCVLRAACV